MHKHLGGPQGLKTGTISTETLIVEIRAAEGGDDAKLLVIEQASIYAKYCARSGL